MDTSVRMALVSNVTLTIPSYARPRGSPDFCWALSWHGSVLLESFTLLKNVVLRGALT